MATVNTIYVGWLTHAAHNTRGDYDAAHYDVCKNTVIDYALRRETIQDLNDKNSNTNGQYNCNVHEVCAGDNTFLADAIYVIVQDSAGERNSNLIFHSI